MNILFLADIVPFPPNTGIKIRTYNILRELHNGGENRVYLLCFNHRILIPTEEELKRCREALKQFCEEVHIFDIPSDASRLSYYGCLIRNLFSFHLVSGFLKQKSLALLKCFQYQELI